MHFIRQTNRIVARLLCFQTSTRNMVNICFTMALSRQRGMYNGVVGSKGPRFLNRFALVVPKFRPESKCTSVNVTCTHTEFPQKGLNHAVTPIRTRGGKLHDNERFVTFAPHVPKNINNYTEETPKLVDVSLYPFAGVWPVLPVELIPFRFPGTRNRYPCTSVVGA